MPTKGNFALLLDLARETSSEKRRDLLRRLGDAHVEAEKLEAKAGDLGNHFLGFDNQNVGTRLRHGGLLHIQANEAIKALARLHLKINPQKTRIVPPEEKLEWLGVVIP